MVKIHIDSVSNALCSSLSFQALGPGTQEEGKRCLCSASFAVFLTVFLCSISGPRDLAVVRALENQIRTVASALSHPSLKAVGIAGLGWRGGIKNKGAKDEEVIF